MQILWLVSWYPNPYEPVNGDFIHRQAIAVSNIIPIDVIHVVQAGIGLHAKAGAIHRRENNLREIIQSFPFKAWGIDWIDKIRYNIKYRAFYGKLILKYASEFGQPQLIHVQVPIKAGIIARYFADLWHIPYMVSEHSSHYDISSHDSFFNRSNYFRKNTAKVFKDATLVTNVSETVGRTLQQLFSIKKYVTIHNLVNTQFFYYQPTVATQNIFRWVHVSSLHPHQKNITGIFKAFEQLHTKRNDWELVIVGPITDEIKIKCINAGLKDKIIFTGELAYEKVAEQMQQANAFVLFSRHENFPCVVPEALCCGLPVVAANVGGVAEAIDESNGLLVEKENVDALSTALNNMMNQYNNYNRQSIAEVAILKYAEETIAQQIVDVYRQLLSKD